MKTTDTHTNSLPKTLLHLEGLSLLTACVALYHYADYSWLAFGLAFFIPDLSFLAYGLGMRVGSVVYNAAHTMILPLVLGTLSFFLGWDIGQQVALIWLAHIAFDRTVGYGLRYPNAFKDSHLRRV